MKYIIVLNFNISLLLSLVFALVLEYYGRITVDFFIYLNLLIMHRKKRADRGPQPNETE